MAATLAPNAGLSTPMSERSVYYDADADVTNGEHVAYDFPSSTNIVPPPSTIDDNQNRKEGTDVIRKPSVAAGALEPRKPAGGGILANNHEGSGNVKPESDVGAIKNVAPGNVRDRGYAQPSSPVTDTKEKYNAIATPPSKMDQRDQAQIHDPSPAYDGHGNAAGAGDVKAPLPADEKTSYGPSTGRKVSKKKKKSMTSDESQVPHAPAPAPALPPRTTEQADVKAPRHSNEERPHASGAFAKGAGVTGPDAIPGEVDGQHQRTATAESQISEGAMKKITKYEGKDAKRLMKVIKSEGKAQKNNLSAFLKELSKMQSVQKRASKDESKALSASNKATARAYDKHSKYIAAKAAYEQAEADAKTRKEALESARVHAQETTAGLAEKTREAEELRMAKSVDDREREARLVHLSQIGKQN
ncbi:hypothetical protein ACEPAI_7164 [Sanghuangporus weigelae]